MDRTLVRVGGALGGVGGAVALFVPALVAGDRGGALLSLAGGLLMLAGSAVLTVAWWRDASDAASTDRTNA